MASIIAHETSHILKRIDFLSVRSALWVTIVDCHRDYDLEQEVHCIEPRPTVADFAWTTLCDL